MPGHSCVIVRVLAVVLAAASTAFGADETPWSAAEGKPAMTAAETRAFIARLTDYVVANHMKRDDSPQRGMVYEYFHVARKGQFDQYPEGEGLDTMHDGAWLAAALVTAYRATGDDRYRELLADWLLPFYLKMLNHSDELFTTKRSDARSGAPAWNREHGLQPGEKGFVPYFWDDGSSVSIERIREKNPLAQRPAVDFLAGKPNPQFRLDGYSQGSSNHMAQDLAVMLELSWLLFKDLPDEKSPQLTAELAEASRNLLQCRLNHFGHIPLVDAAAGLATGDKELLRRVPDPNSKEYWTPHNHYTRALRDFKPGERVTTPGFADDQQYRYYHGIARSGGKLPEALAFKTIYDAFTERLPWQYYSDDEVVPPGLNRFDLHPVYFVDGKPQDYRSERKGPYKGPRPVGSRMGPQNMVCCGWALQALKTYAGIWDKNKLIAVYEASYTADNVVESRGEEPLRTYLRVRSSDTPWIEFEQSKLLLLKSRRGLECGLDVMADERERPISLFAGPDGKGSRSTVELSATRGIHAVNDAGQALMVVDIARGPRGLMSFELPFTAAKGQAAWINGIEHGRYSVQIGKELRNFRIASCEDDVRRQLERELSGGLRTWEAIFDHYGYIPTGIRAGSVLPGVDWEELSDSGGYAHLINAASQWLLYLEGKRDWEQHRVPIILE